MCVGVAGIDVEVVADVEEGLSRSPPDIEGEDKVKTIIRQRLGT